MAELIACILLFICYKCADYQQKQKVEHYDMSEGKHIEAHNGHG